MRAVTLKTAHFFLRFVFIQAKQTQLLFTK